MLVAYKIRLLSARRLSKQLAEHLTPRMLPSGRTTMGHRSSYQTVADGLSPETQDGFREAEPRPGETTYTALSLGYLEVPNVEDASDVTIDSLSRSRLLAAEIKSFQAVVLKSYYELGVLYLGYSRPRSFDAKERHVLESFAKTAALSLHNSRLVRRVVGVGKAAKLMAKFAALGRDCKSTLQAIADTALDVSGASSVVLYTYDQAEGTFVYPPTVSGVHHARRQLSSRQYHTIHGCWIWFRERHR